MKSIKTKIKQKLHNTIQELKGNIRVFCRVRPLVDGGLSNHIQLAASDDKSIMLAKTEESHTGKNIETQKNYHFSFDRVFGHQASQQEIFEEISLLVQSSPDFHPGFQIQTFKSRPGQRYNSEIELSSLGP
uniref:Kinesin motor domain-containing protein n=1 Tax=Kryptolebias marmoratus TaxID=37003 RepID=A0A3Q3FSA2_KRYMA